MWRIAPLLAAVAGGVGAHLWGGGLGACVLAALLGAVVTTDVQCYVIPNRLVGAATLVGVALRLGQGNPLFAWVLPALSTLAALLAVRRFSRRLFQRPGLGLGDVKLAAVMGLYLGWPVFWALYLAFVLGGAVGGVGLLAGRLRRETRLPFAPFLAGGALLGAWVPYASLMTYLHQ